MAKYESTRKCAELDTSAKLIFLFIAFMANKMAWAQAPTPNSVTWTHRKVKFNESNAISFDICNRCLRPRATWTGFWLTSNKWLMFWYKYFWTKWFYFAFIHFCEIIIIITNGDRCEMNQWLVASRRPFCQLQLNGGSIEISLYALWALTLCIIAWFATIKWPFVSINTPHLHALLHIYVSHAKCITNLPYIFVSLCLHIHSNRYLNYVLI